ncbi:MAG: sporulation protein YabP [Lachnospiraceae bacterium]|nr:sporulation protein YabP [Lachnospiraceae bacterium]
MEAKAGVREHKLNILDREQASITGITKVISLEEEQICVITDKGKITIKGVNLHAGKLDVGSGVLEFTGQVDSVVYTDCKTAGQKAAGAFGRLFK